MYIGADHFTPPDRPRPRSVPFRQMVLADLMAHVSRTRVGPCGLLNAHYSHLLYAALCCSSYNVHPKTQRPKDPNVVCSRILDWRVGQAAPAPGSQPDRSRTARTRLYGGENARSWQRRLLDSGTQITILIATKSCNNL